MPHDLAFADAARPAQSVVLRKLMRPYSLGHELLLLQTRNPLLASKSEFDALQPEYQRLALLRAAWICFQTWKENHEDSRWFNLFARMNRKAHWELEIAEFRNYRTAGTDFPHPPNEEADRIANGDEQAKGRPMGSPLLANIYNFLCDLPVSEICVYGDSVFDFPLGLAFFLYFSKLEKDGEMKIENDKEREIKEEMSEHRRAANEEGR